jgi:putative tricarboxylic transport membrane protein
MRLHDALSGILLAVLAVAVLIAVSQYPPIPGQNIGPSAFPGAVAGLLLICAALLIWRGMRQRDGQRWLELGRWTRSPRHLLNVLAVVGGLLFYIFCANTLGFIPTGIILLVVLFYGLDVRPVLILPIAIVATLLIHTIFYKLLRVPLPWGLLQGMIW